MEIELDIKKDGFWYKVAGYNLKENSPDEVSLLYFLERTIFMISIGWLLLLPVIHFYYFWPHNFNFKKDIETEGLLMVAISYLGLVCLVMIVGIISVLVNVKLGLNHNFKVIFLIIFIISSLVLLQIKKIILPSSKNKARILVKFVKK